MRTRFALILYFRIVAHNSACHTLSKFFSEIDEDMVQILLWLEILVTQKSKVEDLLCGAPSGSESSLFFCKYLCRLGFKHVLDDFQHDLARITVETDSSGRAVGCPF